MFTRRRFLTAAGAVAGSSGALRAAAQMRIGPEGLPEGAIEAAVFDTLPGKLPLIKRSFRPPNFETPTRYFAEAFTPNDAFFVRYHLSNIPEVDAVVGTGELEAILSGEHIADDYEAVSRFRESGFEQQTLRSSDGPQRIRIEREVMGSYSPIHHELPTYFKGRRKSVNWRGRRAQVRQALIRDQSSGACRWRPGTSIVGTDKPLGAAQTISKPPELNILPNPKSRFLRNFIRIFA